MTGRLKLHLKANERLFINGGILKVDRKCEIELLNEAVFLLESHVMPQAKATTPLRQLYFVVQSLLIEPKSEPLGRQIYEARHRNLLATVKDRDVLEGLVGVRELIVQGRTFEALKLIRSLFAIEDGGREAPHLHAWAKLGA